MTANKHGLDVLRNRSEQINRLHRDEKEHLESSGSFRMSPKPKIDTQSSDLQLEHKTTDFERYIYLTNLLDHNETLFYRTLMSDPARFLPIVYDPTIGEVLSQVRSPLPAGAWNVPLDYASWQSQRGTEELAGEGCPFHLRHRRRQDPRSRGPRRERHRYSDRKATAVYGCGGRPTARAAADVPRCRDQQ